MFTGNIKRSFFTVSLAGVAFFLPLSEWLLSAFIVILVVSWLANGGVKNMPMLRHEKKIILLFLLTFLVYMVWMINTSDLSSGLSQLRLKLPLLVFPLVTGLSMPLDRKEQRVIITVFISGVVISSIAGVLSGLGQLSSGNSDPKVLSPFISHIRLALMSVFAITCASWYFLYHRTGRWHDWVFPLAAVWLSVFLFLLLSLTGMLLFFLTIAISSGILAFRSGNKYLRLTSGFLLVFIIIVPASVITYSVKSFYKEGSAYNFPLMSKTTGGKPYFHDPQKRDIENGNLVWIYLCEEELSREWNRHSSMDFGGKDKKGQDLKYTLIRYMTSAGLTKDSSGFSSMTVNDLNSVENGLTNKKFAVWSPWRKKLYEVIWQLDYYNSRGNPSGHSITQRLVYLSTGFKIFLRHPLFGTGTGDLPLEYHKQYENERSVLDKSHRLLSHNQFLSFLISFGITGTVIIIWSLFFPFFSQKGYKRYITAMFFILIFSSMLWEDTLETHSGVSFFAYFYSVFIFGTENYENQS
jgi:hypothetical protein